MFGSFTQAFLIFFREGLEIILLLGALVTYVERAGPASLVPSIYVGAAGGVVAALAAALLIQQTAIFEILLVKAAMAFVGAATMIYVSGWVWGRGDTGWTGFLTERTRQAVERRRGFTLGILAFLVTAREGAEIVVFASALSENGHWNATILSGFAAAGLVLAALFLLVRGLIGRLPLRLFFAVTSAALFFAALSLVGEGVMALQREGWISASQLANPQWLQAVGLNATWEAVLAQIMIIGLALTGLITLVRARS